MEARLLDLRYMSFPPFFPFFNVFHLLSWWYDSCCREGIVPKWDNVLGTSCYNEFSAKFMFILSKYYTLRSFMLSWQRDSCSSESHFMALFPLVSFSSNSSKFPATSFWNCLIVKQIKKLKQKQNSMTFPINKSVPQNLIHFPFHNTNAWTAKNKKLHL